MRFVDRRGGNSGNRDDCIIRHNVRSCAGRSHTKRAYIGIRDTMSREVEHNGRVRRDVGERKDIYLYSGFRHCGIFSFLGGRVHASAFESRDHASGVIDGILQGLVLGCCYSIHERITRRSDLDALRAGESAGRDENREGSRRDKPESYPPPSSRGSQAIAPAQAHAGREGISAGAEHELDRNREPGALNRRGGTCAYNKKGEARLHDEGPIGVGEGRVRKSAAVSAPLLRGSPSIRASFPTGSGRRGSR